MNRSLGRLSRHRRGRFAGAVVLLLGLTVVGAGYQVLAPASASEDVDQASQIAQGRELFLVSCSFCHGQNGEGILTEDGEYNLGPSLAGVGAAAAHFQLETGRMPATIPGAQIAAKPVSFTQDEIDALGAYVASLGPGPGVPSSQDYSTAGLSDEELQAAIVRGGQIFLTNCTACHNFDASGGAMPQGKYAPSLRNTSEVHIYEAMLTGPSQMDKFSDGNLSPEEKRDVIAYIQSIKANPGYGGFGMGGLGPVSEGLFAWLFIGVFVGFAVWIAAHTTRTNREPLPGSMAAAHEGDDA